MTTAGARSRADDVLALVLAAIESRVGAFRSDDLMPEVLTWCVEAEDVFCLVYRQPLYGPTTIGLRRTVEPDWTIEGVADEVVTCELGEPLGSLWHTLTPDLAGVMWWTGNPPEWKVRR